MNSKNLFEGRLISLRQVNFSNDSYHDEILPGSTCEEFNEICRKWCHKLEKQTQDIRDA